MAGGLLLAVMALVAGQDERPLALNGETARPVGGQNWIDLAVDYPAAPLRAREEGTTVVRLFVNGQGRVSGCAVLKSSDVVALDMATCRMLRGRARFEPFAGAGLATFDYRIVWDLALSTPIQPCTCPPEHIVTVLERPHIFTAVVPLPSLDD